jgi:3-hydroxyacyl-CoA dehydrogenase
MASSKTCGLIGAGTTGSGIAQLWALAGLPVAVIDVDGAAARRRC